MTLKPRILEALPATLPELCAVFELPTKIINTHLQQLKTRGQARRTDRAGMWMGPRGPAPHLWERT